MQVTTIQFKRTALLISLFYCLFGIVWIIISDTLNYSEISAASGADLKRELLMEIVFVICSSGLIFFLVYYFDKKHVANLLAQQEMVAKSEKLFRAMIENTEDIISLVDKDGNVMYVNPALEKLTGFTLNEVKGKPAFTVMHPENIEDSKAAVKKLLDNPGVVYDRTNRFIDKRTGGYIWVQGTVVNLLNDENVGAIVSNYRDVSAKKLIEQKNIFNHSNLKALINNTNDLMWSVDREFKLVTSNKAFDDMMLYLTGKNIVKGDNLIETDFDTEKLNRFKVFYERAFNGEAFTVVEHDQTPQESWSEISLYPIYTGAVIVGTACFVKNVTERKHTEEKLNQFNQQLIDIKNELELNEFKLKQAQAIAHVGSWEIDFASEITTWSEETCRIYGVLPEENKQPYEVWRSFIHPDDFKRVLTIIKESHDTLNPPYFYYRIVRKDGSVKYIYSKMQFEFNAEGEATGLYGVTYDVTEQKLAEQEILQKNEELRSLSNHLQTVREKERAAIAREIHDELGQQLTALKMDIGWVLRKQHNADQTVVSKIEEMLKFSDDLIIKVRKISSDLRPAIIDDLGLVAALEWMCDDFEKKTEIACNFTSNVKERKFEEDFSITAYRIVQESLTNIIRHAKAKSVTILVTENEKEWFLEVTDNGKGISTEKIKNKKTLGVVGMKERAALLGGELTITGVENKGTTVRLILPLKNELTKN
jgi:PAS domain S-box-containing protein